MEIILPELAAQLWSDVHVALDSEDEEDTAFQTCPDCGVRSCDCDAELLRSFDLARGEFLD